MKWFKKISKNLLNLMKTFIFLNLFFLIIFYFFNLKAYKIASLINLFDKPNKRKFIKQKYL